MEIDEKIEKISVALTNICNRITTKNKILSLNNYISAEYFSLQIFNILFNTSLQNLNESTTNVAYIDLLDKNRKIGIQVTLEKPNSEKVKNSVKIFENENLEKLIVFFFVDKKTKIENFDNVEIWTLKNIVNYARAHPEIVNDLLNNLEYWINSDAVFPDSFINLLNISAKKNVNELIKLKNYDFDLYVEDFYDSQRFKYFCAPNYSLENSHFILSLFNESPYIKLISKYDKTKKIGKMVGINSDIALFNVTEFEELKKSALESYDNSTENKKNNDSFQYGYRYTEPLLHDMVFSYKASNSIFLPILRPAGQGKTFFCCKKAIEIIDDGVPTVFISPSLSRNYPHEVFKSNINQLFNSDNYLKNLSLLAKFLRVHKKVLIIFIDAINEYGDIQDCCDDICNVIDELKKYDVKIKVVISARSQKYDELNNKFRIKEDRKYNIELCNNFYDNTAVLVKYLEHYKITYKKNKIYNDLCRQNRLFIGKFCEKLANKDISNFKVFDFIDILESYFSQKAKTEVKDHFFEDEEEFLETIYHVTQNMIDNNSFADVPLINFELNVRKNIVKLADKEVFSVSEKNNRRCVSFVFEYYRDFFLSDILSNKANSFLDDYIFKNNIFEGTLEMLFLRRRNDKKIDVKNNYNFKWYCLSALYFLRFLPDDFLYPEDEQYVLAFLNETNIETEEKNYNLIESALFCFFKPYSLDRKLFLIKKLHSLKNEAFIGLNKFFKKRTYLIDEFLIVTFEYYYSKEYILSFIRFLEKCQIKLSYSKLDRIKSSLKHNFNLNQLTRDNLLKVGFNISDLDYLEIKNENN